MGKGCGGPAILNQADQVDELQSAQGLHLAALRHQTLCNQIPGAASLAGSKQSRGCPTTQIENVTDGQGHRAEPDRLLAVGYPVLRQPAACLRFLHPLGVGQPWVGAVRQQEQAVQGILIA